MKKSSILLVFLILSFVFITGCINLTMSENVKVNKNAQFENVKFSMKMDRSTYNFLKTTAKGQGYASIQEMIQQNLSKSIGSNKAVYNEVWDNQNDKVTISVERTDTHSPESDSKINIQKVNNQIIYEDNTFYSDKKSEPASPYFNESETERMTNMMLSGISMDYYLEMPGKIVDGNADTIKDNKAEWHLVGADISKTKIYAKSDIPILPFLSGFEMTLAFLGIMGALFIVRKRE